MALVKRKKAGNENISITMSELVLINIDRSRADIRKWWTALINAEQISWPNRSRLYDLYERVTIDGHLSGLIQKRIDAVLNKTLHYEIDGKRIEELDDLIDSDKFQLLIHRLMEKKLWGLTGIEFVPGDKFDFVLIPRKHIKPEEKVIAINQNDNEGIDYSGLWNVMVIEDVERFGLFLKCAPLTIWKSGSIADLAQYIELFGQPIRKGTYPGDDPEAKANLKAALKESGSSFTVIVPDGTNIEIIGDHITNGTGQVYDVMIKNCNNELSIIVLGNTETTSNDNGGSNAKSVEHGKQQLEINKRDIKDIGFILSGDQFKTILKSYGYPVSPGDKGKFVFEKETDLDELSAQKDIWLAVSAKVPISPDDWYDKFGIPKPDNFNELMKKMDEEKMMKLQPPAPAPPFDPKKDKKPKPKNLNADYDYDFEPDEEKGFFKMLKSFFVKARR